jgi:EmrB/QacA subfamily drug resistance transporter
MVLFLGSLMIVLDSTVVNVALPSIRQSLGFSESGLAWVVNAYLLTFGGLLLLGGRLGDLYGRRKLFIIGTVLFTAASLACALSQTALMLIIARAVQGVGGAIASAVSLALIMSLFTEEHERARAMGYFGFIAAGGGSLGLLLGGLLTNAFNWHAIFIINVPIGIAVVFLTRALVPETQDESAHHHLDIAGATTITLSLLTAVYGVVNGGGAGWLSLQTLGLLAASLVLLALFIGIETRSRQPLVPMSMFQNKTIAFANIIGVLWAAGMFAWFFIAALYLQVVLGYGPLAVGLAFFPSNIIMAAFSLGLSARMINRFGIQKPLALGLVLAAGGLVFFSFAPVAGHFIPNILPGMLLLGLGAGMAFNPVLLAAMNGAKPEDAGLASGIVNTSFMMGGALGLAILASIAAARTAAVGGQGLEALMAGYHLAFFVGGIFALTGALLAAFFLKVSPQSAGSTVPVY